MSNVVAIVQARMSSSRFPGKVLAPLHGKPLILHVLDRASSASRVSEIVLATSDDPSDDPLVEVAAGAGYECYRGSLDDVLGRFAAAAASHHADIVVRLTGDCPLLDGDLIDEMVDVFERGEWDYLSNASPPSFPDGLDVEIMRMEALAAADAEASGRHEREHVTPFIRERRERFRVGNFPNRRGDWSHLLWSVDRPADLEVVDALLAAAGVDAHLDDLVEAAFQHKELTATEGRRRNEGAILTLRDDMERRAPAPRVAESLACQRRAEALIPAGTQTLSKGAGQFCRGFGPSHLVRGEGAYVWDVDGNRFLDYPMGLGPVTLGHGHPAVVDAVCQAVKDGNSLSLCHPLEIELAERIVELVPCAQQVRFGKNGSDATSACIRAARASTGRDLVARHGYHGWQDWAIEASYGARAKGVPSAVQDLTRAFPYNDLAALEAMLSVDEYACVILEPVNLTPPDPGYLEGVKDLAHRHGALLVFDEVITGFRYALGGAQQTFGVTPDLAAMGKGVGNGVPISVVCGTREAMSSFDDIFFSFTFGGDTMGLAAALATLRVMEDEDYSGHCWAYGARLQQSFNDLAQAYGLADFTRAAGMAPWTVVTFDDAHGWSSMQLKTLFQQEMLRRGVLFSGSQFVSLAHGDDELALTEAAYRGAFEVLRSAIDFRAVDELTLGGVNEVVFRRG